MTEIEALISIAVNAFVSDEADSAVPTAYFGYPPYHVEHFPTGSCVCRADGLNCLTFTRPNSRGAVFTTAEKAQQICETWNANGTKGESR